MPEDTIQSANPTAFPRLADSDLALLRCVATPCSFDDGQIVFRAGDADLDLFVVESGALEILNPSDDNSHVATHTPGEFAGDIDLHSCRRLREADGFPLLDGGFQTSVPGLHVAGALASHTFGPLCRFVAGTDFTARRIAAAAA